MTAEELVIVVVRVLGSLPVLRWPFAGGLLAVLVDLSDLFLMNLLELGGVGDYQRLDKYLDQVYLGAFLAVALRWAGTERTVAVGLYLYRFAGFVAFEISGQRALLLVFPNVFELWILLVGALHARDVAVTWSGRRVLAVGVVLLAVKEVQEWAIHGARLFDHITAVDAVKELWRRLTGG